jgi:tetratricopeptide (TPR) repeat protein
VSRSDAEGRAEALVDLGRYAEALEVIREGLAREPRPRLWGWLAIAQRQLGDADGALAAAMEGVRSDPEDEWLYRVTARCLWALRRRDDAMEAFRAATALGSNYASTWAERAWHAAISDREEEAHQAIERALSLGPEVEFVLHAATVVHARSAEWDACEAAALAALRINPSSHLTFRALAWVKDARDRDYGAAADLYAQALALAPDNREYLASQRDMLNRLDRYDEALALAHRMAELDPHDPVAWVGVAQVHVFQHRWQEALEAADHALACDGTNEFAHRLRATSLFNLGRREDGLGAIRLATDHWEAGVVPSRPWIARASFAARCGRYDEADECLERARQIDPTSISLHRQIAKQSFVCGQTERAAAAALLAMQKDPGDSNSVEAAGYAAAAAGDWEEALRLFQRSLELYADNCCAAACVLLARSHLPGERAALDLQAEIDSLPPDARTCGCELPRLIAADAGGPDREADAE